MPANAARWYVCQFPYSSADKLQTPQGCWLCHRDSAVELLLTRQEEETTEGPMAMQAGAYVPTYTVQTFTLNVACKLCKDCNQAIFMCKVKGTLLGFLGAFLVIVAVALIGMFGLGIALVQVDDFWFRWGVVLALSAFPAMMLGWGIYYAWTALGDPVRRAVRLEVWPTQRSMGVAFSNPATALAFVKPNLDQIELSEREPGTRLDSDIRGMLRDAMKRDVANAELGFGPAPSPEDPKPTSWIDLAEKQMALWSRDAKVAAEAEALLERRFADFACPQCSYAGSREHDFAGGACPKCHADLQADLERVKTLDEDFGYEGSASAGGGCAAILATGTFCVWGLFAVDEWGTLVWMTAVVFFASAFAGSLLGLTIRWIVQMRRRNE